MISAWRKSTVSPLGFIHFKVSVPPAKTTPSPLLSYIIEKWIRDGWGIYPLGFIHYWVNVWRPWGNTVPPWASYFSHAICKLTFSNRRCPPLCSYITKNVWRGGGVYKTPGEGDAGPKDWGSSAPLSNSSARGYTLSGVSICHHVSSVGMPLTQECDQDLVDW